MADHANKFKVGDSIRITEDHTPQFKAGDVLTVRAVWPQQLCAPDEVLVDGKSFYVNTRKAVLANDLHTLPSLDLLRYALVQARADGYTVTCEVEKTVTTTTKETL